MDRSLIPRTPAGFIVTTDSSASRMTSSRTAFPTAVMGMQNTQSLPDMRASPTARPAFASSAGFNPPPLFTQSAPGRIETAALVSNLHVRPTQLNFPVIGDRRAAITPPSTTRSLQPFTDDHQTMSLLPRAERKLSKNENSQAHGTAPPQPLKPKLRFAKLRDKIKALRKHSSVYTPNLAEKLHKMIDKVGTLKDCDVESEHEVVLLERLMMTGVGNSSSRLNFPDSGEIKILYNQTMTQEEKIKAHCIARAELSLFIMVDSLVKDKFSRGLLLQEELDNIQLQLVNAIEYLSGKMQFSAIKCMLSRDNNVIISPAALTAIAQRYIEEDIIWPPAVYAAPKEDIWPHLVYRYLVSALDKHVRLFLNNKDPKTFNINSFNSVKNVLAEFKTNADFQPLINILKAYLAKTEGSFRVGYTRGNSYQRLHASLLIDDIAAFRAKAEQDNKMQGYD